MPLGQQSVGVAVLGRIHGIEGEVIDGEEMRKRIATLLRKGPPSIALDNVTTVLKSGVWASAVTATVVGKQSHDDDVDHQAAIRIRLDPNATVHGKENGSVTLLNQLDAVECPNHLDMGTPRWDSIEDRYGDSDNHIRQDVEVNEWYWNKE